MLAVGTTSTLPIQVPLNALPVVVAQAPSSKPLFDVALMVDDVLHHATRGQGPKPGVAGRLADLCGRWVLTFPLAVGASVALASGSIGAGAVSTLVGIFTLPFTLDHVTDGLNAVDRRLYRSLPEKPAATRALGVEFAEGSAAAKLLLKRLAKSWLRKLEGQRIQAPELERKLAQVAATPVSQDTEVVKRVDPIFRLIDAIPMGDRMWRYSGYAVLEDFNALSPEDRRAIAPILRERFFHKGEPRGFAPETVQTKALLEALDAACRYGG